MRKGLDTARNYCSYCSRSYFSYCAVTAGKLPLLGDMLLMGDTE